MDSNISKSISAIDEKLTEPKIIEDQSDKHTPILGKRSLLEHKS